MPRGLRYQDPGAVYHLMARGDGGKAVFQTDEDRLAVEALARMKLPTDTQELAKLRKGDGCKVLVAYLVRQRTAVGIPWFAEHLAMGHPGSVSRSVSAGSATKETLKNTDKTVRMLKCVL